MENNETSTLGTITLTLPVHIDYSVLETLMKEKMTGEFIEVVKEDREATTYAQILDVTLEKSTVKEYDLAVQLKIKMLTTLFTNKEADLFLQLAIHFNEKEQKVVVHDYDLNVDSNSWLMNTSLQAIANIFAHNTIKNKMKFDFLPEIEKQLLAINEKLENQLKIKEGVFITGNFENFRILSIDFQLEAIQLVIAGNGKTAVAIKSISL